MDPWQERVQQITRRYFLQSCQLALGALAMGLWERRAAADEPTPSTRSAAPGSHRIRAGQACDLPAHGGLAAATGPV